MSVRFLSEVFNLSLGSSSLKAVAIALADRADDKTGMCFPSIEDTVQRTELNKKTVELNVRLLKQEKILVDTGRRVGKTNQIPIYFFDIERLKKFAISSCKQPQKRNTSKNGAVPIFPESPPKTEVVTPPKTGDGTTIVTTNGTTTSTPKNISDGDGGKSLDWPPTLADEDRRQIIHKMPSNLSATQLQAALDEFRAAIAAGRTISAPALWILATAKSRDSTPGGRAYGASRNNRGLPPLQKSGSSNPDCSSSRPPLEEIKKKYPYVLHKFHGMARKSN